MKVSSEGMEMICKFEGFRAKAYFDTEKILTIGYGHVIVKGEEHLMKATLTEKEARDIFAKDLKSFEAQVTSKFNPVSQNHFDSITSFVYNAGIGNATNAKKSDFYALYKKGHFKAAAIALLNWGSAQWKSAPGLKKRRQAEAILFMKDDPDFEDWCKVAKIKV